MSHATNTDSEILTIANTLHEHITAAMTPTTAEEASFVTIPPGYTHKDITDLVEKAAPAPYRKRGTVQVFNVASLLSYLEDQGMQTSAYVYADPDKRTMTAVFNDMRAEPGWRDHRACFKAEFTPEFSLWLSNNAKQMSQTEFAEFIEDNLADLQGNEATTLLTVATTLQASTGIAFASSKRLQDGQTQLTYNETIDSKAGADGALTIPKTFALGLRIFKNGEGYKLTARLKFRMHSGSVKFWFELERPERAIEDAFKGYVQEVADKSGYRVLLGTP